MTATFTPAPVNPSERAVGWDLLSDAVPVRLRPSGASRPRLLSLQAPGITFGLRPPPVPFFRVALVRPAGAGPAGAGPAPPRSPRMVTSGMTAATLGLAASSARACEGTVAANEFTSWYCRKFFAPSAAAAEISGACSALETAIR